MGGATGVRDEQHSQRTPQRQGSLPCFTPRRVDHIFWKVACGVRATPTEALSLWHTLTTDAR